MTQSGGSSQLATGWALLGLAAAGQQARSGRARLRPARAAVADRDRRRRAHRPRRCAPPDRTRARFGGRNLIADILRHRRKDGSFDGYVSYTSFAILALRRSGVSASSRTIRTPRAGSSATRTPTAASTSAVAARAGSTTPRYAVQALVLARRGRRRRGAAAAFLARQQGPTGRLPADARRARRTRSRRPTPCRPSWPSAGTSARSRRGQAYLRSLTESNGLVRYSRTGRQTPVWVSAQALLALRHRGALLTR